MPFVLPIGFILLGTAVLAQVAPLTLESALLGYGPLGGILIWFMIRGEAVVKEIRAQGNKIDGLRMALLANTLSNKSIPEDLKQFCRDEIEKVNEARIIAKGDK